MSRTFSKNVNKGATKLFKKEVIFFFAAVFPSVTIIIIQKDTACSVVYTSNV